MLSSARSIYQSALTSGKTFLSSASNGQDQVIFDSTITVSKEVSGKGTNHAIEKGADVTDHINYEPLTMHLTAIISDSNYFPFFHLRGTVEDRLAMLETWMMSKEILNYSVYDYGTIKNVFIESYKEDSTIDTGDGRQIELTLKQIIIVDSKSQDIPLRNGVTKKGPSPPSSTSTTGNAGASKPVCSSVGG
ncbi:hypothetical protein LEP1GSC047_1718 [Leptospira inadai serovar Lyme str. 10]|uniref:Dit-like phage tail protein N-terminal domain-containing protein n=2 Tax=Leptospira inadai serovar Lyme TaxID=293084 RepID=V6HA62_9LEPT|nr:hypothetical protein [Leptospira inadai]EQA35203.1 hypothetical protein LEP1GSC047_1718 [Leptospira inadai serovar Lyme str. 10]PNV76143.1 hypothetical protein BES34_003805 [Leptospira inadai serovar Lyme]